MAAGPSLGPSGSSPAKKSFDAISRREIEALIADGRHIIIVDQYVLKVDAWLPYHPGGDKAIKHMVGRDATDEVNVYAPRFPPGDGVENGYRADATSLGSTPPKLGAPWTGIESAG